MDLLARLDPQLANVEWVATHSTSSGLRTMGGKPLSGPPSFHIYLAGDVSQIDLWSKALYAKAIGDGLGHIKVSKAGVMLDRTILDKSVFLPERIVYEAGAQLGEGLDQDRPDPIYHPGDRLDTGAFTKLTVRAEAAYKRELKRLRKASKPTAEAIRQQWVESRALDAVARSGGRLSILQGRRSAKEILSGRLGPDEILHFRDGRTMSVKEAVAQATDLHGQCLYDPIEPEAANGNAQLLVGRDGQPVLRIYTHGLDARVELLGSVARPAVLVPKGTPTAEDVDDLDAALSAEEVPLYLHAGAVVVPGIDKTLSRLQTPEALQEMASRYADLEVETVDDQGQPRRVPSGCPKELARHYLANVDRRHLKRLKAAVWVPFVNQDGKVVSRGYDPDSQVLVHGGPPAEDLPSLDSVTERDVEEAKAFLAKPFAEFEWENEVSAVLPLVQIFTIIQRAMMSSAPLLGYTSPGGSGVGKTLVADAATILAQGRPATPETLTQSPEENRKRIEGAVLKGRPVVMLDNVSRALEGDSLCAALTGSRLAVRELGRSGAVEVEIRGTWIANGINLVVAKDMRRRAFFASLKPGVDGEYTSERTYAIRDLKSWALEHHEEAVRAVLTMVLAYIKAGRPAREDYTPLVGFEHWDQQVRQCLDYHGYLDPIALQRAAAATNADNDVNAEFLEAIWRVTRGQEFVLGDLAERIERATPFPSGCDALIRYEDWNNARRVLTAHSRGGNISKALPYRMRDMRGTTAGGFRLVSPGVNRTGVNLWQVEALAGQDLPPLVDPEPEPYHVKLAKKRKIVEEKHAEQLAMEDANKAKTQ
jgi:hypothetical protein